MLDVTLLIVGVLGFCFTYGILSRIAYYAIPPGSRLIDKVWGMRNDFEVQLPMTDKREFAWPVWLGLFIIMMMCRPIILPFQLGAHVVMWSANMPKLFTKKVKLPQAKVVVR